MLRTDDCREVHVYVSNGSVAHFTIREMHELYTSWQLWVLICVGFMIMTTGHPVTLPQFDSFGLRLAFWCIALAFYLVTSTSYSLVAQWIWDRTIGGPIPLILLSTPLVLAATYLTSALLTVMFEPGRPAFYSMTWQMNLRNVFVAHVFETVALLWLLPAQRAQRADQNTARSVTLAGRRFVLARIRRVKGAEHYLEVYCADGKEVIRERMVTFLEQVGPGDGIQTHRSHWVASDSALDLTGSKLRLRDGEIVPVARGRLEDVRLWLAGQTSSEELA
ncbi:LytTR family DNA-binding domain-containing protein [uncultured Tateyamaria sp.]|uniref:LytTR family DNA-binding domain-containing protein n=1 Tax=uncultured Tateyamaria sp. TaxID=455651 RepID=UPI002602CAC6|nr:LytTR family DNA-binding domain-containing protein [uncultured Tateyamaria sp.]